MKIKSGADFIHGDRYTSKCTHLYAHSIMLWIDIMDTNGVPQEFVLSELGPLEAVFRGETFGRCLDPKNVNFICRLTHWWIPDKLGSWEAGPIWRKVTVGASLRGVSCCLSLGFLSTVRQTAFLECFGFAKSQGARCEWTKTSENRSPDQSFSWSSLPWVIWPQQQKASEHN